MLDANKAGSSDDDTEAALGGDYKQLCFGISCFDDGLYDNGMDPGRKSVKAPS